MKTDKITEEIKSKINKNKKEITSALIYFPLVGWIIPLVYEPAKANKGSAHGRQSLNLNILLVAAYLAFWILKYFPITAIVFGPSIGLLNPLVEAAWLIVFLGYLGLSIYSAFHAYNQKYWEIPLLLSIVNRSTEYFKRFIKNNFTSKEKSADTKKDSSLSAGSKDRQKS